MAELIDRAAYRAKIHEKSKEASGSSLYDMTILVGMNVAANLLESMPTIDAVQVVRCKDCALATTEYMAGISGLVFCDHLDAYRGEEFWCAAGRKRMDADAPDQADHIGEVIEMVVADAPERGREV